MEALRSNLNLSWPSLDLPAEAGHRPWQWAKLVCIGGYGAALILAWLALGVNTPYPGDEERFIQSASAFAGWPSLELLRTYEEMSGPWPFWYWGNWAAIFGDTLASMRLATMVWGILAGWLLWEVLAMMLGSPRRTLLAWGVISVHPYWWTMGVFAYTDVFALAGLLAAAWGVGRGRAWLTCLGLMIALLSRQYLVLAMPALGLMALAWQSRSAKIMISQFIALMMGCLPLLGLMVLWRGLQPRNELHHVYETGLMSWSPGSCALYVSLIGLYGAVWWVLLGRSAWPRRGEWALVALAVIAGLCLPVVPSLPATEAGFQTVGLLDVFLSQVLALPFWARQVVWTLGMVGGLLWLWRVGRAAWQDWRRTGQVGTAAFAWLMVMGLLAVMPLSYLHWEKYFLPVLPWVAAGFLHAFARPLHGLHGSQRAR